MGSRRLPTGRGDVRRARHGKCRPATRNYRVDERLERRGLPICRLAQRLDDMDGIAPALAIWAYWVGPLLIAEIALQLWNRRSPAR